MQMQENSRKCDSSPRCSKVYSPVYNCYPNFPFPRTFGFWSHLRDEQEPNDRDSVPKQMNSSHLHQLVLRSRNQSHLRERPEPNVHLSDLKKRNWIHPMDQVDLSLINRLYLRNGQKSNARLFVQNRRNWIYLLDQLALSLMKQKFWRLPLN